MDPHVQDDWAPFFVSPQHLTRVLDPGGPLLLGQDSHAPAKEGLRLGKQKEVGTGPSATFWPHRAPVTALHLVSPNHARRGGSGNLPSKAGSRQRLAGRSAPPSPRGDAPGGSVQFTPGTLPAPGPGPCGPPQEAAFGLELENKTQDTEAECELPVRRDPQLP